MTGANENTDYSNGKIYVIISPNHDLFYYGSTVEELSVRYSKHKSKSNCTSHKIINAGDADIYEIETYPCSCLEELEDREAFYIVNDWDGCVNERVPGTTRRAGGIKEYKNDYYKKNSIKIKNRTKKWNQNNKEKKKAKSSEQISCNVCGCYIRRGDKARHQKSKKCQKFLNDE